MANRLNTETVSLEDIIIAQSYEIAALVTLLERKGIIDRSEILSMISELRAKDS